MTRIHILKSGTFRDMNGADVRFTAADIAAIAKGYDPKLSRAPIVIGHPGIEDPAYGWAASLTAEDDGLYADPEDIDPDFAELVRKGRYSNVSASLYRPTSPGNPKPGQYYLRHIGFLGAQPPAVKGLKRAQLAGGADDVVTVALSEESDAALWVRFKSWLKTHLTADFADGLSDEAWNGDAGQWSSAEAYCEACLVDLNDGSGPKVKWKCHLPVWEPDGDGLNRHALFSAQGALIGARGGIDLPTDVKRQAAKKLAGMMRAHGLMPATALDHIANFTETEEAEDVADTNNLAQRTAALDEREKALKAREDAIAGSETEARKKTIVAFADELVGAGRLLPKDKPLLVRLLGGLKPDETIELADGSGTKTVNLQAETEAWLKRMPQLVPLGEKARREGAGNDADATDPVVLAEAATKLVKQEADNGNTISHAEAVRRIVQSKENAQ